VAVFKTDIGHPYRTPTTHDTEAAKSWPDCENWNLPNDYRPSACENDC
jgi:hypothetical protein